MAPLRPGGSAVASTSKAGQNTNKEAQKVKRKSHHSQRKDDASTSLALPGVQKIKAALRQTRRLLAKDKLAADVRTKTERRLKSLEADLAQAERVRKERAMAARYHAVKFFERQKVTRRIQQIKRQLAQTENTSGKGKESEKLDKKERKKLEKKLEELRVDLNYIIHYPKLKKYISLFPPEIRSQPHAHPDPYPHSHSRIKSTGDETTPAAGNDTDAQREEVRAWVYKQMAAGEMSTEPEVEVRSRDTKARTLGRDDTSGRHGHKATSTASSGKKVLEEDPFFGDDDEGIQPQGGSDVRDNEGVSVSDVESDGDGMDED